MPIIKQYIELINRWTVFGLIALVSAFTILYVANVIYINKLLQNNQLLDKNYEALRNNNNILKTRLNQIQSPSRIINIAEKNLGMKKAEELPIYLRE
ncbi:MAG TPA: cell division protein FtsL [Candidatus Kapabacteria bacterium]|nr:cell division protein FtsL [Candidatus Kapabacteria bacterium]HPO63142.1 cell division protein FtsL [Candidatus Kapabacteria bacterium]